jgi:nucleoside-triphosphatase THEP1
MNPKILITGPPRCGKSTLILKLINHFTEKNLIIHGFLTPEVKKSGMREGFDILDIKSGYRTELARIGNFKTPHKLGKYCIFTEKFEKYLLKLENFENLKSDLIIIDEIGKMELYSKRFQELIRKMFDSEVIVIATIGEKVQHPVKDYILSLQNITLFNLNRKSQEEVFKNIISAINK